MSKLINFNKDYKNTSSSIRASVSSLQLQIETAIKQQCYIHTNPDSNITDDDFNAMQSVFFNIIVEFNKLCPMVEDMTKVSTKVITIEELTIKYSVDVVKYSAELKDSELDWA